MIACAITFGLSFALATTVYADRAEYFGFGVDPWNLPGTILGGLTFFGLLRWWNRRPENRACRQRDLISLVATTPNVDESLKLFAHKHAEYQRLRTELIRRLAAGAKQEPGRLRAEVVRSEMLAGTERFDLLLHDTETGETIPLPESILDEGAKT